MIQVSHQERAVPRYFLSDVSTTTKGRLTISLNYPDAGFSFPGIGKQGPANIGVALFSFPNVSVYEDYRKAVAEDSECKAITAKVNESKCFRSYERAFLKPILR